MNITQEDLNIVLQPVIFNKLKIQVLDDSQAVISVIYGIVNGSMSIDAAADIRRSCNFTVVPTWKEGLQITEDSLLWLNKTIVLSIGIMEQRTKQYRYYPLGHFLYTNTSGTYDAVTNQLTVTCSDFMNKLNGTKNGQIGTLNILFPAYEENKETGEVIKYNLIKDIVIQILTEMCHITNYMVDDIGEHKALPAYNNDWQQYRLNHEQWNALPYDLEFSCGSSLLSILTAFRDLYPNFEMFFNQDNVFICQMIPGCYEDEILFDNAFLRDILISESTALDMTTVRNISEVWGRVISTDFYTEACSMSGQCYQCTVGGYDDEYYNGDIIAVKIDQPNLATPTLNINRLGEIPICDENTELPLEAGVLEEASVMVFRIKKQRVNKQNEIKAFLLGHWQAHAMDVLVDGSGSTETFMAADGSLLPLFSKKYFQQKYNCESINLTVIPNSPFTVQRLGEILDVKTCGEYENITSDSLALARAKWENWKNCRLTDSITLTTKLIPFYDVNQKVSYQRSDSDTVHQYIIQSVAHDFTAWTSTISMYRFYPLYEPQSG